MNRAETLKVMAVLNATYPTQFIRLGDDVKKTMVNVWQEMFAEDSYEVVIQAVKNHIQLDTAGFIPTIGAIKESIRKLHHPNEMTEQEAIATIMQALGQAYYKPQTSFDSLPAILRRIVGTPEQLQQWSIMELETVQSVIASNIGRTYRALARQEREQQTLRLDSIEQKKLTNGDQ
jgi:hypothetical protein